MSAELPTTSTVDDIFGDIAFASCMIPSNHALPPTDPVQVESNGKAFGATFTFTGSSDILVVPIQTGTSESVSGRPANQPGGGLYTSPLTTNTSIPLESLISFIMLTLTALQLQCSFDKELFKFNVSGYFISGYAHFTVRIWSKLEGFAVEVMRESGDRIFVTRAFEFLARVINMPDDTSVHHTIDDIVKSWTPDMFEWAPKALPFCELSVSSPESIESGIIAMIAMVRSIYDDISTNGCLSIIKLVNGKESTREYYAKSQQLVKELVNKVTDDSVSTDTRTLAALALRELNVVCTGYFDELTTALHNVNIKMASSPKYAHKLYFLAFYLDQVLNLI